MNRNERLADAYKAAFREGSAAKRAAAFDSAWNESEHPRASNGEFGAGGSSSKMSHEKAKEKHAKLLALAHNNPNKHEGEAAAEKAKRLATEYGIKEQDTPLGYRAPSSGKKVNWTPKNSVTKTNAPSSAAQKKNVKLSTEMLEDFNFKQTGYSDYSKKLNGHTYKIHVSGSGFRYTDENGKEQSGPDHNDLSRHLHRMHT